MPKKRNKIQEPFVPVPSQFLRSPVWRLLSHAEREMYLTLRVHWSTQTRNDYGQPFTCPYPEFGCARATVAEGIRKLERFGELEKVQRGGLFGGETLYRFRFQGSSNYKLTPQEEDLIREQRDALQRRRKASSARRSERLRAWGRKQVSSSVGERSIGSVSERTKATRQKPLVQSVNREKRRKPKFGKERRGN